MINDKKNTPKLPIDHERAPQTSKEVTPSLKGGEMEQKVKRNNKA